jgi:hypothetical protein
MRPESEGPQCCWLVQAEKVWTQLLELDTSNAAAWSNRANCRTSLGGCGTMGSW